MAEPRSSDQTDILNAYLDGQSVEANYWIGLTDKATEALFLWNSDGQNTEGYHNWYGVNPNDGGNCVHLSKSNSPPSTTTTTTTSPAAAPATFIASSNTVTYGWNDYDCASIEDDWEVQINALCQKSV